MLSVKEYLKNNILLFDGAMGTYFSSKNNAAQISCEYANISCPDVIKAIHKEYIQAGCKAVKTNTFSANSTAFGENKPLIKNIIKSGYKIAAETAGDNAYVFADIGPLNGVDEEACLEEYKRIADIFLNEGAQNFLFETLSADDAVIKTAKYIKEQNNNAFIIASFAALPDGFTREGASIKDIIKSVSSCGYIDAAGLNCISGARHMSELIKTLDISNITFSAMPNAGYPTVINNRTFYKGDPEYFALQMKEIASLGVKIIGGCCGTTPEHIRETKNAISGASPSPQRILISEKKRPPAKSCENAFYEKLSRGEKVIALELDPPEGADAQKFMDGAKRLKEAGIDILTIADCPVARARMDSSILACMVKNKLDLDALPHMTCRDRNLNAAKALLFGVYANNIRNILIVTGDPIPGPQRETVKSVYQFNSRKLAAYISSLCESEFPSPVKMYGALNINALSFDMQLKLAKQKIQNGMCGFLTQPALTQKAMDNLKRAKDELDAKILGGIIPVVSERNAVFMNNEINGITVSDEIIKAHRGKTREESEKIARDISVEIAYKIAPHTDGFYLMTPFNRIALMEEIVSGVKELT